MKGCPTWGTGQKTRATGWVCERTAVRWPAGADPYHFRLNQIVFSWSVGRTPQSSARARTSRRPRPDSSSWATRHGWAEAADVFVAVLVGQQCQQDVVDGGLQVDCGSRKFVQGPICWVSLSSMSAARVCLQ